MSSTEARSRFHLKAHLEARQMKNTEIKLSYFDIITNHYVYRKGKYISNMNSTYGYIHVEFFILYSLEA